MFEIASRNEAHPRQYFPAARPDADRQALAAQENRIAMHPASQFRNPQTSQNNRVIGWGARIRTWEWRYQKPLPYHLATPQLCGGV
jgi:hypothetical protein